MSNVTPERILIQQEETAFKAGVAESLMSRVGATANFINLYQAQKWEWKINGEYSGSLFGADGVLRFPFNWEIVDCYIFCGLSAGSSGTTELDLKWKPFSSGGYASLFSTTPKFSAGAANSETCGIGQSKSFFTAPVLSKTQFDAYDQVRMDLITSAVGAISCGISIDFRPR